MSSKKCTVCLQATINERNHKQSLPPLFANFADDDTLLSAIGKLNPKKGTNAFCSHCQVFTVRLTELNAKYKTLVCKLKSRSESIRAIQNPDQVIFETEERTENPKWEENHCDQQSEKGSSFSTCGPQAAKGNSLPNAENNKVAPNRFQYGKYSIEKVDGMFKCGECGVLVKPAKYHKDSEAKLMLKHILKRHESSPRTYVCEYCGVVYNTKRSLTFHKIAKHGDPNSKFPCTDCNKIFGNRISVMSHRQSVHRKTPREKFICKTCGKKFNRKDFLDDHVAFVHNRLKMHECEQCSKRFGTTTGLKIHRSSSHTDKRKYIYDISGTPSMEESGFASNSRSGYDAYATAGSCTNIYKDDWLPKNFLLKPSETVKRLSERDFVYKDKHPFQGTEAGFKCGLCSIVIKFSTYRTSNPWYNLINHLKKWHMDGNNNTRSTTSAQPLQRYIQVAPNRLQYGQFFIEKIAGMYQCVECRILNKPAKPCKHLKNILLHIKQYHENPSRTYVCELCGAVYNKPRSLSTHKIVKHGNPDSQFPCTDCDRVFSNRVSASRHRYQVHLRPSICEICGKSFRTKVLLEQHVAFVHYGQRLIECEECGKKFATEKALGVHKNSHTGKKKFVCDICGMDFTQQYSVTRHKKTAHET